MAIITEVNVKAGETFDASGPAYSFSPEKEDPVLRIDTSKTTLTISRGTEVTFDSARGGTVGGRASIPPASPFPAIPTPTSSSPAA